MYYARSGHEHQQKADRAYDHDGSEVRFEKYRQGKNTDYDGRPERAAHEQLDLPSETVHPHGNHYDRGELGELARLQTQRPERDPAVGAVDRAKAENHPQENEHRRVEQHRQNPVVAPDAVVEPRRERRDREACAEIHELPLHEEVRVVMQTHGVGLARAGENNKAQRHENRDNQAESE